ncbi:RcnB family protein [Silvibacterium sp.]|uniref:RcnB family protein n=1 Tax=Silvibacterium sp. TaxID=1964179 RepID=UPI0039E54AFF
MMIRKFASIATLACTLAGGAAFAQDHGQDHGAPGGQKFVKHSDWKKGGKIQPADWNRGQQVDYRQYHLNAPPSGYQWREVDGNFVLAAVATGVISSVIVASTIH